MAADRPCCAPPRPSPADSGCGDAVAATPPATDGARPSAAISTVETAAIPAGRFVMGTDDLAGHPADGEGPAHPVDLAAFRIGVTAVTNEEFAAFVAVTGYTSTAERFATSFVAAMVLPDDFPPTRGVAAAPWWREVEGADWAHPEGPQSSVADRGDHPVVHVSWDDAVAYCDWVRGRLPTEAEWERAARGGLVAMPFPWGAERTPGGAVRMNTFVGEFPVPDPDSGWAGAVAVRSYPANGFGLYETTGNVWEWCGDWFDPTYYRRSPARAPLGPEAGAARVMRGGSYLCHHSYCRRYRVDARSSSPADTTAGNIGFRVVVDDTVGG